jgi:hypothetical protein
MLPPSKARTEVYARPLRRAEFEPAPNPGYGPDQFRMIAPNGFGDGHNSFPHSVAWFKGKLYVGTTRSNFQMLKIQHTFRDMPAHLWPVEGPDDAEGLYRELDRRAQIWAFDPLEGTWERVFIAPEVPSAHGPKGPVARETGLRSMAVFQGASDPEPALYIATWAVSRSPGALLLRTTDGVNFEPVSPYGIIEGLPITATRVLVPYKDRLITSPTGTRGFDVNFVINVSGHPVIYESRDPAKGEWVAINEPGFGDLENQGILMVCEFQDKLYASTFNNNGFELWCSDCLGEPPYEWECVIDRGADRGPNNQIGATMHVFKGALYIGTAIQNGGHDLTNQIGPAGSEVIRVNPDHSWDIVIGDSRYTRFGKKQALSGVAPGFGNVLNGYFWSMTSHDGWLYVGSMNSMIWVRFLNPDAYNEGIAYVVGKVGAAEIVDHSAGCSLWRTADGDNWLPVTKVGFDNRYNLGVRNLVSTPYGLCAAVSNPFGPRVAAPDDDGNWRYIDNPRGGCEIWLGRFWEDDPPDSPMRRCADDVTEFCRSVRGPATDWFGIED